MFNVNDLIKYKTEAAPHGVHGIITDILEVKSSNNSTKEGKIIYRVKSLNSSIAISEVLEENILRAYSKYYEKCEQEVINDAKKQETFRNAK